MPVEQFRGYVAAIIAGLAVVGGVLGAVWVWQAAIGVEPPPDTTLIFGIFTGLIGTGTTFLFMSEAGSRASHAALTASEHGASNALQIPGAPVEAKVGVAGADDPDFPGVVTGDAADA